MQEEEKQAQTGNSNEETQENNSSNNSNTNKTAKKKTVKRKRSTKKTAAKKTVKAKTAASADNEGSEETAEKTAAPKRKKTTRKRKKKTTAAKSSDENKTETTVQGKQAADAESKVTSEPQASADASSSKSQTEANTTEASASDPKLEQKETPPSREADRSSTEKTQQAKESSPPASPSSAAPSQTKQETSSSAQAAPARRYSSFSEGIFDDSPAAPAVDQARHDENASYDPDTVNDADAEEKTQETATANDPAAAPAMPITILPKDEEEDEELNELAIADDAVPEDEAIGQDDGKAGQDDSDDKNAGEKPTADATEKEQPSQQQQGPRVIVEQATSSSNRNSRNGRRHHGRDNYGPRDKQRDSRPQQNRDQRSSARDDDKSEQSQQQRQADQQQNRQQQDNRRQQDNRGQQRQQQDNRNQQQDRRNQQQDSRDQQDNRKSQQQKQQQQQTSQQRDQQKSSSDRGQQSRQQDRKSAQSADTIAPLKGNKREMLINMAQDEECRIAVVEKGRLEELYIERKSSDSHVGNIYKGRITNVEPSIQACFVDFGIGQNGFLHISDLQSCYFPKSYNNQKERVGCKRPRRDRPPIQECIKRGQELIVQITKEGIGTKGPTLTTYLSIPGRFLVLMPGMNRMGISRKIEDEETRLKAKKLLQQLDPPKDMGFILRTAGLGRPKRDIQRDMTYLTRLWETIQGEIDSKSPPALLYQESDLVIRTVRDVFNSNITRIICDREETVEKVNDFLSVSMPRTKCQVILYQDHQPLFNRYRIDEEIQKIQARHVPLQSGGSLVIDPTEAIIAIDVNSGKYRVHDDAETTAFRINKEAAPEIARQLKLRDLGGVIIMDFIDMLQEKHRREIERTLRDAVSTDRARTKILRMSQFGIIEMTRQRMRPSLKRSTYMDCPHCNGSGLLKTPETAAIQILRQIQSLAMQNHIATIEVNVSIDVASFLLNQKRQLIMEMESAHNSSIVVMGQKDYSNEMMTIVTRDRRGSVLNSNQ